VGVGAVEERFTRTHTHTQHTQHTHTRAHLKRSWNSRGRLMGAASTRVGGCWGWGGSGSAGAAAAAVVVVVVVVVVEGPAGAAAGTRRKIEG